VCAIFKHGCRIQRKLMLNYLLAVAIATSTAPLPQYSLQTLSTATPTVFEYDFQMIPEEAVPESKSKTIICKGCNSYESRTLEFLQKAGITDKNAIATIMGNIRQESTFIPNICEGGTRTTYSRCRSGGFGLIQFTSSRFHDLGRFARLRGTNPDALDSQLEFMRHETDWKMIEPQMKTPGGTITDYMRLARKWIRWGHHGARTDYAYEYRNKLAFAKI